MDTDARTSDDLWGPDRLTFEDELDAWFRREEARREAEDQQADPA